MNEKLIFNSSIVEPGCVWIVEYLKNLGVELHHDFNDINGIEQARTLANDIDISASFIPYSTILLSKNRKKIIKKFNCIMPITFEEQVIIVDRDSNGNFQLDNINCPERGSGHYELMVSKNDTIYKDLNPNIIDLNRFTNKLIANNSIILYQPAADLFLESKRNKDSAMWGFVKNRPFPIDIIFIAKYDSFNGSIEHLKKLIHLILYKYKSDSIALSKQINKFYKKNAFRRKFIVANNHFFNQIVDSN